MADQRTNWDSQLNISLGEGTAVMTKAEGKLALARLVKYCEDEAQEQNLPFVAYCLSLATGALAEEVDSLEGGAWSGNELRLRRKRD